MEKRIAMHKGVRIMNARYRFSRICIIMGVLLVCLSQMGFAQTSGGTISGVVTDSSGAVMPGVAVQVTNQGTGTIRNAITDNTGRYRFDDLMAGSYELSFARPGFETANRTLLLTAESRTLDVILEVSGVATSIIVREVAGTLVDIAEKTTASRMEIPDRDLPVQVSARNRCLRVTQQAQLEGWRRLADER